VDIDLKVSLSYNESWDILLKDVGPADIAPMSLINCFCLTHGDIRDHRRNAVITPETYAQ